MENSHLKDRDKKNNILRRVRNQEAIHNVLELRAFACKINGNLNIRHDILFILQAAKFFKDLEKDYLFKEGLSIHFQCRTSFNKPPSFGLMILFSQVRFFYTKMISGKKQNKTKKTMLNVTNRRGVTLLDALRNRLT